MLKHFARENNLQKVELETDIRESTLKQFMAKNFEFREKWKCNIQQRFPIKKIPETLLFTHKLDTCCQAMCQEHKTAKNPAFRQRRILNRLDSVTVCTAGVNSKPETNAEPDAIVSIMLTGNIEDISFLYDFPCQSGVTLYDGEKCIMYLCFEQPSEISFVCTEKNINEKYLHILKAYLEKIIERIDKRQTNEIIYAIETMETE